MAHNPGFSNTYYTNTLETSDQLQKYKKIEGPHFNDGCGYRRQNINRQHRLVRTCTCRNYDSNVAELHNKSDCYYMPKKDTGTGRVYHILKCSCDVEKNKLLSGIGYEEEQQRRWAEVGRRQQEEASSCTIF